MYQRILILLSILVFTRNVHALHINCNEKGFYCKNSTHFYVCVDIGGGFTITMDDVEQQCPDNTYCDNENKFECMEITTTTTTTTTPKNPEASVLTLQWPASYLSNLGMDPATVQPNPTAPITQTPIAPVPPSAVPSPDLPGTTIVKEEYEDNYLKFLPIIKRDTIEIDNLPGTVPPYTEGANNSDYNDATTISPLNSTTSNLTPTSVDSFPPDKVSSNVTESSEILNENPTTFSTPYSTPTNKSNSSDFTLPPNSFSTFDSSTPYIIPTDEYTYSRNSTKPISISQTQSVIFVPSTQDSVTSTTETNSPTSTVLSTTEPNSNSTTLDSITTTDLNSTTPDSEFTIDNLFNSTTEYPISSTLPESLSSAQNLYNTTTENPLVSSTLDSTSEYPISSTQLDSLLSVQDLYNSTTENPLDSSTLDSTTEYPISSTLLDSLSSVQDFYNSTTKNPLDSSKLDSTIENPSNSTSLDPISTNEDFFNSTLENPLNSTTLDSTLFNSTRENQPNPTTWVPISNNKTTENPLNSTILDSTVVVSTTEIPLISTTLDSTVTTLTSLNSSDNTRNSPTPDSLSSTESSILNLIQSPDIFKPSPPLSIIFNATIENIPEILNLTEVNHILEIASTIPSTGFETTTVKNYIDSSVPQEKDSGNNSVDNVSSLISKFVNFSSNNLPDVPLTPDHAISTRMIQTTEILPFNNRLSGFVPGNVVNTGAYPATALPLTIPLPISNDPNANNACQRPGQYSDENSCHSYYMCNNNVRYKLVCPYNMVYSPSLQKCTTAKDHCLNYNDFTCNQVGRFPDSRSCYSYYDCQPNGAGFTASRIHCPWYSSFQPNNGQCVTNNNGCGCQQTPQTCRYPQQAPMEYQGGQSTPFTFYPENPVTYGREYGYPPVSSTNVPVNVPIAASTPYLGDRVLPADRVDIYNRENALPVDPSNTFTDRDYIREKIPVGVNYPYFGDNVVSHVDRTPTYVRDGAPGVNTNDYIKDYTPIVGNAPYVQENALPIGGTNTYYQNSVPADQINTYYQNSVPADQINTYYQNKVPGENTYNGNINVAPVESSNNKYIPANVGSVDRPNPSYIRENNAPSTYDSGFNYYPTEQVTNRLAGTNNNLGDRTRWSQPDPNNEASGQWTPNNYGSWFN